MFDNILHACCISSVKSVYARRDGGFVYLFVYLFIYPTHLASCRLPCPVYLFSLSCVSACIPYRDTHDVDRQMFCVEAPVQKRVATTIRMQNTLSE